jgi:hypothetical protein
MYSTEVIYSDLNIAQLESLSQTQPHRDVDLTLVKADQEGPRSSHIDIFPRTC